MYVYLTFFPPQSEVNAANRTSETIMKNIGAEKKVQDSKVLKKLSGDEAVQVCMYYVPSYRGSSNNMVLSSTNSHDMHAVFSGGMGTQNLEKWVEGKLNKVQQVLEYREFEYIYLMVTIEYE